MVPYFRNIRNILLSGVSQAHIVKVCKYISNETAVSKGKMFPFQYFTAYDVLNEVKELKNKQENPKKFKKKTDDKEKEKWMIEKEKKRTKMLENVNIRHVDSIQKSLDTAVNISARRNIPPLKGTTLILCAYGLELNERFTAAKVKH